MRRRDFIIRSLAAVASTNVARPLCGLGCAEEARFHRRKSLHHALDYLWRQQAEDGGWHSKTYAVLRSGQAMTPFVLSAILSVPDVMISPRTKIVDRALDFIRSHVHADGSVGTDDPEILEYPTHSTAATLQCMLQAGRVHEEPLIQRLARYLQGAQYGPAHGFTPQYLAYGAWGFAAPRRQGTADHLDISHTRFALQALRAATCATVDVGEDRNDFCRAALFLRLLQRCQNEDREHPQPIDWPDDAPVWDGHTESFDGGFYFSPIVLTANKAGWSRSPTHWRSYATATCDGLLALFAAGVPRNDGRVTEAANWLARHPRLDYPEGVPEDHPERWGMSIQYYHLAARSECYAMLNWHGDWREQVWQFLQARQQEDGSFRNHVSHLMKEDDPLLCTALAVRAMAHARLA